MKRIFKKNQIIITTLAIMLAIAGYLNYSGRLLKKEADSAQQGEEVVLLNDGETIEGEIDQPDIETPDADGMDLTSNEAGAESGNVGEAVLASTGGSDSILAQAKLNREQVRAKSKEEMLDLLNHENLAEEQKQQAAAVITEMAQAAEEEAAAELLLEAKGFEGCVVSIAEGTADVVINEEQLDEIQRAQIEDIVSRKTGISIQNIIISPVKASEE